MKLLTCYYDPDSGWDTQPDTSLDSPQTLVVVFGAARVETISQQLQELVANFSQSVVVGCSTAGEIYCQNLQDDGMVVGIAKFEQSSLRLAITDQVAVEQSKSCGEGLARELNSPDLKSVFLLSEGLHINGSLLVEGISQGLADNIVITGGLAADQDRFEKTWVLVNGKTQPDKVVAVGFYGEHIRIHHGSRGGWDVMGPEREVTKADGNVLYELDHQPALQLYKKYLGERADGLPATGLLFPLAIRNTDEHEGLTVRTILAIDEAQQSITFAGNMPEGVKVQLMYANFDRLVDGASDAATRVSSPKDIPGDKLCIAISCVGRRLILGQRTEEEIDAVCEHVPENTRLIGYYSYGEISPLASGRCDLHNQTMTLTLIGEDIA